MINNIQDKQLDGEQLLANQVIDKDTLSAKVSEAKIDAIINQDIPEGYMKDHRGFLIPMDKIKEYELIKDQFIKKVIVEVKELREKIKLFKDSTREDITVLLDLLAEDYGVKSYGNKGNYTLVSYDGMQKISITTADRLEFDERLQLAKAQLDTYIKNTLRMAGDNENIRNLSAILIEAFDVDKEGKVNKDRVLRLKKLKIKDADWEKAIKLIDDSMQVASTKEYVRFYEKDENGGFKQISLDFANV